MTSAIVIAANTTITTFNSTNETSITGVFLQISNVSAQEFSFPIDVWASTQIKLDINEDLIRATLFLDDGSLAKNQKIEFFLNNISVGSGITNSQGFVDFPFVGEGELKVVFKGNESLYFNPSEQTKTVETEQTLVSDDVSEPTNLRKLAALGLIAVFVLCVVPIYSLF